MATISVTSKEQKAIKELQALAKKWPKSIMLFSWSGSLVVMKYSEDGLRHQIITIQGIPNDGGDPGRDECEIESTVIWPGDKS